MVEFGVSERHTHSEGTFAATAVAYEPVDGNWGPRIKWTFETQEMRDDGTPARLSYFTGTKFGKDAKINGLVSAVRLVVPLTDEEAKAFDVESVLHRPFRVQVAHKAGADGQVWANITGVLPPAGSKPAATPALPAPAADADGHDPFDADDPGAQPDPQLFQKNGAGKDALVCSTPECGRALTQEQYEVSIRAYGRPMCPPCQKASAGVPAQRQGR